MRVRRYPLSTIGGVCASLLLLAPACGPHADDGDAAGGADADDAGPKDRNDRSTGDAAPRDSSAGSDARDVATDFAGSQDSSADVWIEDSVVVDGPEDASMVDTPGPDTSLPDVSLPDAPEADTPVVDDRYPDDAKPPVGPQHGWALLPTPLVATPAVAWFAEAPNDPNILLVGADRIPTMQHHLYRSIDGGSTWTQLHQPQMLHPAVFAPSDAKIAYAIEEEAVVQPQGRVARSVDGGVTWEVRGGGAGVILASHVAVDVHDPAKVYVARQLGGGQIVLSVSADGGATWADSAPVLASGSLDAWDVAFDTQDASRIYLFVEDGQYQYALLTSNNGGSSWQTLRSGGGSMHGGDAGSMARAFAVAPSDPGVFYLVGVQDATSDAADVAYDLCRSGDRGATWSCHPIPVSPATILQRWSLIGVDANDSHSVFVANQGVATPPTLYRSTNDGASWTSIVDFNLQPGTSLPDAAIVSPSVTGRIFVAKSGVTRSTDGGTTFLPVTPGLPRFTAASMVLSRDDDRVFWLGTFRTDQYLTSNGAASWTHLDPFVVTPDSARLPYTTAISYPGRPRMLFWDEGSEETAEASGTLAIVNPSTDGLFRTPAPTDGGYDAGQTLPDSLLGCAIAADATSIRYCCTAHGLYRTSDGGRHWSPTAETSQCVQAHVDQTISSIVYARFRDVLRRSDDGGVSFGNFTPPDVGPGTCDGSPCTLGLDGLLIDGTNPLHLFARVLRLNYPAPTVTLYEESLDRGGSWRPLAGDFDGRTLYLDPRDSSVLYAAGRGGIRKSRDGGASWFDVNTGLDGYDVCDLRVGAQRSGLAYAAVCAPSPQSNTPERHGLYWTVTGGE